MRMSATNFPVVQKKRYYIYVCVCVCIYRERERERETKGKQVRRCVN